MKNTLAYGILFLSLVLLSTSCATKKQGQWLDDHARILKMAATSNSMSKEQKFDALANSYVRMMHQSLNFTNPKKGVQFAREYSKQNSGDIDVILKGLKGWKDEMGPLEGIAFGVKLVTKPYFKDLIALYPRFQRKYRMYSAVADLSGRVKKGLIDVGGNKLKDLGN